MSFEPRKKKGSKQIEKNEIANVKIATTPGSKNNCINYEKNKMKPNFQGTLILRISKFD